MDIRRSCRLTDFAPLAQVSGVTFYSLQKGEAAAQAQQPPAGLTLHDDTTALHDFADTAALIAQLDLVITVDTAVAHLAGALGKPTWTLLSRSAEWRWGLEDSTPWYPSMRLFRQSGPGEWGMVMQTIAKELAQPVRA